MKQAWEYKFLVATQAHEKMVDQLGADGWELVAVHPSSFAFIFKRPR